MAFLLVVRFFFLNLLGYDRNLVVGHPIIKLIEALVLYLNLIFSIVGVIDVLRQVYLPIRVIFPGCPVFVRGETSDVLVRNLRELRKVDVKFFF